MFLLKRGAREVLYMYLSPNLNPSCFGGSNVVAQEEQDSSSTPTRACLGPVTVYFSAPACSSNGRFSTSISAFTCGASGVTVCERGEHHSVRPSCRCLLDWAPLSVSLAFTPEGHGHSKCEGRTATIE